MTPTGPLDLLAERVDEAFDRDDVWAILTAVGLDEAAMAAADATVALLAEAFADRSATVVDIGAGVGRHVRRLAELGFSVVALEPSPILADIATANTRGLEGVVVRNGGSDTLDLGTAPVVCTLMSDTLSLIHPAGSTLAGLQALRQSMADHSRLVIEAPLPSAWPTAGTRRWGTVGRVEVTETVQRTDEGVRRRVFLRRDGQEKQYDFEHGLHSPPDLTALLEQAGFRVEWSRWLTDGRPSAETGATDVLVVAVARKGWNFLSDLPELIDAWRDPDHVRNKRPVDLVRTEQGRLTNRAGANLGVGTSLTRHHPDFLNVIEPRIRPLVKTLTWEWDQIPYSSCEGHLVLDGAGAPVLVNAYVGLMGLSDRMVVLLVTMLGAACDALAPSAELEPVVRERHLHGPGGSVPAVDLFLLRREDVAWPAYEAAVVEAVADLCRTLRRFRGSG